MTTRNTADVTAVIVVVSLLIQQPGWYIGLTVYVEHGRRRGRSGRVASSSTSPHLRKILKASPSLPFLFLFPFLPYFPFFPLCPSHPSPQGRNHGWKVEGNQGLGPNTGALVPRARSKAGLGVGCGRGSPLRFWGSGVLPPENFENSDAKSCILVTLAVKFLAFWKLRPRSWLLRLCFPSSHPLPFPSLPSPPQNGSKFS